MSRLDVFGRIVSTDKWSMITIAVLCFVLYSNTFQHAFTQDDAIVIYNNEFTQRGIEGIPDIFAKDSFYGYFGSDQSELVSGGRYRPMSIAFFAIVYEIAGLDATVYHVLIVGIYALLCLLLFRLVMQLDVSVDDTSKRWLATVGVLLFAAHPVHTEVVANVKGLDEIFSLLFGVVSAICAIQYYRNTKPIYLLMMGCSFFCALLSKENAIIYVLVIPAAIYFMVGSKIQRILFTIIGMMISVASAYIVIRWNIIGWNIQTSSTELLNNPFIKVEQGQYLPFTSMEKWSSIVYGLGKYIQLLVFPHPLTHDYYPRHFPVSKWSDIQVLMGALMNICLVLIAILGIRRRSFISFAILFFYVAIGLMANIIFPIGTHISERFLFTASVGFCFLVSYGAFQLNAYPTMRRAVTGMLLLVLALYSVKTYSRNKIWKDDFTLFTTDAQISTGSAKVQNAAGGALIDKAILQENIEKREAMLIRAKEHLTKALDIHPNYKSARILIGNAHLYLKEYAPAIEAYERILSLDNTDKDAHNNLFVALKEGARHAGSKENNVTQAIEWLARAIVLRPDNAEVNSLMGIALGNDGRHAAALLYFEAAIEMDPENARNFVNKGYALAALGNEEEAQISFQKALRLDPNAMNE